MSDAHDVSEIKKHVKVYIWIFIALLIGTVITVLASYIPDEVIPFGARGAIVLALLIASAKAFLVAGYFMHLLSERKMIYSLLILVAIFFAGLMYLTYWSMEPENIPHIKHVS